MTLHAFSRACWHLRPITAKIGDGVLGVSVPLSYHYDQSILRVLPDVIAILPDRFVLVLNDYCLVTIRPMWTFA